MDDVNAQQNVGYAAHEVNPTDYDDTVKSRVDGTQLQSYKTQKSKYPPPSNELIFGHNENDVLLGRGATTNIHSGNQHFRNICAMRKPDFDAATNAQKRQIAIETVQTILALDPPGHFLERVEGADEVTINDDGTAFFGALGGNKNVDIHGLMSPSNAKHLSEMGGAQNKTSKHWKWAVGPWRDVGMEKAINKTLAVLRDHGRQDRIALKAMGLMKKSSKKMNALGVHPSEVQAVTPPVNPGDVIPTNNDIIIGRGAFINRHQGNIQFRSLCYERKERFDSSLPAGKQACALEIVELVKSLGGRFLIRDPRALQEPVPIGDGSYRLPPRGLEGPWEEVTNMKACSKTIQVLRDLKAVVAEPTGMAHQIATPHTGTNAYGQPGFGHLHKPDVPGIETSSHDDSHIQV